MTDVGTLTITQVGDRLRIDHADPTIRVSVDLLDQLRQGNRHPDMRLDGDLLTITGVNRTVLYRVQPADAEQVNWPQAVLEGD